jgi:hypothetical protein
VYTSCVFYSRTILRMITLGKLKFYQFDGEFSITAV